MIYLKLFLLILFQNFVKSDIFFPRQVLKPFITNAKIYEPGLEKHLHNFKNSWDFFAMITRGRIAVCGGSLIGKNWVLTSSQCTDQNTKKTCILKLGIAVAIGATQIQLKSTSALTLSGIDLQDCVEKQWPVLDDDDVLYPVDRIFHNTTLSLIKLAKSIDFVKPVKISTDMFKEQYCHTAGFGLTQFNENLNFFRIGFHKIYEIGLNIHSKEKCRKYDKNPKNGILDKVCGTTPDSQEGTYKGEIGAPVICNGFLQGVVYYMEEEPLFSMMVNVIIELNGHYPWIRDCLLINGGREVLAHKLSPDVPSGYHQLDLRAEESKKNATQDHEDFYNSNLIDQVINNNASDLYEIGNVNSTDNKGFLV